MNSSSSEPQCSGQNPAVMNAKRSFLPDEESDVRFSFEMENEPTFSTQTHSFSTKAATSEDPELSVV